MKKQATKQHAEKKSKKTGFIDTPLDYTKYIKKPTKKGTGKNGQRS